VIGTIFAYGQTSSGKTHTMKGDGKSEFGIIPFAIADIFAHIEQTRSREFLLRCAYMEIYNENIADLLVRETLAGLSMYVRRLDIRLCATDARFEFEDPRVGREGRVCRWTQGGDSVFS
jgi:hypothetical protein